MKKIFFAMLIFIGIFSMKSQAQLGTGFKAVDFTFTALNNNNQVVNLYDWLDSNKYVIIDVSATWCGPCWEYHKSKALEDLYSAHGPGTATNDVRVVFIEGDASTTDDNMNGIGSGAQGNWLAGTLYPMCNPSAATLNPFLGSYDIRGYPTVYIVCPDRTIRMVGTQPAAVLYSFITSKCPDKILVEVSPSSITGKLMSCSKSFDFDFGIKSRGFDTLKNATINIKYGNTIYGSKSWTGSLATYTQSPYFTISATNLPDNADSLIIEILADNDQVPSNNTLSLRINSYTESNAINLPYTENFNTATYLPAKFSFGIISLRNNFEFIDGISGTKQITGADGQLTKSLKVPFYDLGSTYNGIVVVGNFNTTSTLPLNFEFDISHAQRIGTENDKLEVIVSTDCGLTWVSKWSKMGTALSNSIHTTTGYYPTSATQWRHETVDLSSISNKNNVLVGFRATSGFGNNAFIDNISFKAVGNTLVEEAEIQQSEIFPNPANEVLHLNGIVGEVKLFDVLGKEVWNGTVNDNQSININFLESGIYYIKLDNKFKKFVKF